MIKELGQLIEDCREELEDEVAPYLWTDEYLTKRLNEAVEEAAIRARLLVESDREDICQITLVPDQAQYTLHESVLVIRRAVLASDRSEPICRTTTAALDGHRCRWREETGTPEFLVRDQQARTITIAPIPTAADVLHLTVWRLPTDDELMEDDGDEPCIEQTYHDKLMHWACFRALSRRDMEQQSTKDADRHLSIFEAVFGERPTAAHLQSLAIDPVTGTAPVWF
ncbi:MAG: DUF6682 family protein [Pseudoxanthomonas sp.]